MKDHVSQSGRCHGCSKHADSTMPLEITDEQGKKEKLNKQFLEVIVVAVPEFRERSRLERHVRIPKDVESCHSATCDDDIATDRQALYHFSEMREYAGPGNVDR